MTAALSPEDAMPGDRQSPADAQTNSRSPRIFVQIASYRDPDCQHTVKDLFDKASKPERVFVGICWQTIEEEDAICFVTRPPRPAQVRIHRVDAMTGKGVCWARSLTQKLFRGEEFTLQIDSHMRFEPGWDESLLDMWVQCKNPKAVITAYPPSFSPPDERQTAWVFGMAAKEFDESGILMLTGEPRFRSDRCPAQPMPGAFVSACVLFGPSSIIHDVPYDPHLYFFGEEITLAARLWTSGYDIYHPNRLVIYHDWDRSKRPTHFTDHRDWRSLNDLSKRRARHLLGVSDESGDAALDQLDSYGLGKDRTLAEYEAFSGVDFSRRTLSQQARSGLYTEPSAERRPAASCAGQAHRPKKVYESESAVVLDDFLPEEVYRKLHDFCLQLDYERINTKGASSRAWHVHDGFPLRSTLNEFYYAAGVQKPEGAGTYPTATAMDSFVDALRGASSDVCRLVGREGQDWAHLSATAWLYPHGTGLSMHDDGSGVYSGAYVYFLNPEWRVHWGGLLLLVEGEGNTRIYEHRKHGDEMAFYRRKWLHANAVDELLMEHGFAQCIFPKRNRIVFLANNAYHMVTRVNEAAGDNLRMSIAGFFNRKK